MINTDNIIKEARLLMSEIWEERRFVDQDLYLVAGQLQERNVSPIDSWTFFQWMQNHGIPSRYILKESDIFYHSIKESHNLKDVVVIKNYCKGYGIFVDKEMWLRARAFVVEWDVGTWEINKWLNELPGLRHVFLQHGIIGTCFTNIIRNVLNDLYNDINVSSQRELLFIKENTCEKTAEKCFVAGLPRLDLIKSVKKKMNLACGDRSVIFVMFTWRDGFRDNIKALEESTYWQGIQSLISKKNTQRLKYQGIEMIVSLHHSLLKQIPNLADRIKHVKLADQDSISYWLQNADAFITDFSSASFDVMYRNKPTIYWIPDEYDENQCEKVKSAIKYCRQFYNIVHSAEEVISAIEYYSDRQFTLEQEKVGIAESWFDLKTDISKHVYDRIEERLQLNSKEVGYLQHETNILIKEKKQLLDELTELRQNVCDLTKTGIERENTISLLASTIERYENKYKKHLKAIKILATLASALLITVLLCLYTIWI